jgi:hypothetical protein
MYTLYIRKRPASSNFHKNSNLFHNPIFTFYFSVFFFFFIRQRRILQCYFSINNVFLFSTSFNQLSRPEIEI